MKEILSTSTNDTKRIGNILASVLTTGDTVVLSGDLGSGKTVLVSGFLGYYNKGNDVSSPTFTIVNEHELTNNLKLFHFDVYRFNFEEEFSAIGGEEFFNKGICIIEWGEKIKNLLPLDFIQISFEKSDIENSRTIRITSHGKKYEKLVEEVF